MFLRKWVVAEIIKIHDKENKVPAKFTDGHLKRECAVFVGPFGSWKDDIIARESTKEYSEVGTPL